MVLGPRRLASGDGRELVPGQDRAAAEGDARVRPDPARVLRGRGPARRARSFVRPSTSWATSRAPDLPIYVAALSAEDAPARRRDRRRRDALALQSRTTSATSSCPRCSAGRERAGKQLDGFDIVAAVPAAVTDDTHAAYDTMRTDLITYWSLPFYRAMIERSGFGDDIAAFDAGMQAGDVERARAAISDGFLELLTAIGTADEVRAGVEPLRQRPARRRRAWARCRAPTSRQRSRPRARIRALSSNFCGNSRRMSYRFDSVTDGSRYSGEEPRRLQAGKLSWALSMDAPRIAPRSPLDRHLDFVGDGSLAQSRAASRRSRSPDIRPAGIGHGPLQLPLPVLHAGGRASLARSRRDPQLRGDRALGPPAGRHGHHRRPVDRR